MCPSTSCGTRAGSQFGIWPATAVIRPKVNAAVPRTRRRRRRATRRSFRILRLCPFGTATPVRRLRRNKRRILALDVLNRDERPACRSRYAAVLLLCDHHRRPVGNEPLQVHENETAAAVERSGGLRLRAARNPSLVRSAHGSPAETIEHERAVTPRCHHQRPAG